MIRDPRYLYHQHSQSGGGDPRQQYDSQIAKTAVKEVFAILGVDVDDPAKVEEFRKDLRFGGTMRRATDRGVLAMVGVVFTALGTALCFGIVALINANNKIGGHGP